MHLSWSLLSDKSLGTSLRKLNSQSVSSNQHSTAQFFSFNMYITWLILGLRPDNETALHSNDASHRLGTCLEPALYQLIYFCLQSQCSVSEIQYKWFIWMSFQLMKFHCTLQYININYKYNAASWLPPKRRHMNTILTHFKAHLLVLKDFFVFMI